MDKTRTLSDLNESEFKDLVELSLRAGPHEDLEQLTSEIREKIGKSEITVEEFSQQLVDENVFDFSSDLGLSYFDDRYVSVSDRIRVPRSNDCETRKDSRRILLPTGFRLYDYNAREVSANPPNTGMWDVRELKTGVEVSWEVKHIGWILPIVGCGGKNSWLTVEVVVRGVRESFQATSSAWSRKSVLKTLAERHSIFVKNYSSFENLITIRDGLSNIILFRGRMEPWDVVEVLASVASSGYSRVDTRVEQNSWLGHSFLKDGEEINAY